MLVDFRSGDDAGVLRLDAGRALVQTVDFLTPIVDDPGVFGAIAAANALSDIFAMGAEPLSALAIAGLPERDFPPEWAADMFRGGAEKLREAGCVLLGGHTVRDPELKFGYAITGLADPDHILTNAGAREGDDLYLTKPLGTGMVATAQKKGRAGSATIQEAQEWMLRLNRIPQGAREMLSAATDVTGFGLVGHALGLARESHMSLALDAQEIPILRGVTDLALEFASAGLNSNRATYEHSVAFDGQLSPALQALLFDPQTSGGLLFSASLAHRDRFRALWPEARRIGHVSARKTTPLVVRA